MSLNVSQWFGQHSRAFEYLMVEEERKQVCEEMEYRDFSTLPVPKKFAYNIFT